MLIILLPVAASGCGSPTPESPALAPLPGECASQNYPAGPYGTRVGDTIENACFEGFMAPETQPLMRENLERVAFADFYRQSSRSPRILLINSAAVWCSACRAEHEELPARTKALSPRGLMVLTALFEDGRGNPATFDDLQRWIETFSTSFPIALDPTYQLGAFASADTAPVNIVVDATTMAILHIYIGDQAAVMWPFIESRLAAEPD